MKQTTQPENMDKQDKIQFALIWFAAGMLFAELLMILTQAR